MMPAHAIAAAGGGAAPLVAGGGAAAVIPLAGGPVPGHYIYEINGIVKAISYNNFGPHSRVHIRGKKDSLTADVHRILSSIPGIHLQPRSSVTTDIIISTLRRPLFPIANAKELIKRDERFTDYFGVIVPREHALNYARGLLDRYIIMQANGQWLV